MGHMRSLEHVAASATFPISRKSKIEKCCVWIVVKIAFPMPKKVESHHLLPTLNHDCPQSLCYGRSDTSAPAIS